MSKGASGAGSSGGKSGSGATGSTPGRLSGSFSERHNRALKRPPLCQVPQDRSQRVPGWNLPDWATVAAQEFVVQQDVGHMMMLEQPDEFCRIVDNMLARLPVC
jgi:hypothetical protein